MLKFAVSVTCGSFLVCPASTAAVRTADFPSDEPLDELGIRQATATRPGVPGATSRSAPRSLRCRQSAEALGVTTIVDNRLSGCDDGTWTSQSLDEVAASDPQGLAGWLADPADQRARGTIADRPAGQTRGMAG
ncbi:MAG: hypothetical protein QOG46_168 [Pseudonocardiales bacterium]|nr:hypothetical protein [Pseudonocardiales bacterium]